MRFRLQYGMRYLQSVINKSIVTIDAFQSRFMIFLKGLTDKIKNLNGTTRVLEVVKHAFKHRSPANAPPVTQFSEGCPAMALAASPVESEMLGLYQVIESMLPQTEKKIIQFIGALEGEGTSTVSREFAQVCVTRIGKPVLLLEADCFNPSLQHYFELASSYGWLEAVKTGKSMDEAIYPIENCRQISEGVYRYENLCLCVSPSCGKDACPSEVFNSPSIDTFFKEVRQRFDLTIIDSPPLAKSQDGLAVAPKVDGVVIIVEAERTRWTVAENLKERVLNVGGNVLGVVLNKRRFYIPPSIYKHL